MRRHGFKTPVLMLTAKDAIEDRILGLDAGANDYLVKPFAFPELLLGSEPLAEEVSCTVVIFICRRDNDKVLYFKSACRGRDAGRI